VNQFFDRLGGAPDPLNLDVEVEMCQPREFEESARNIAGVPAPHRWVETQTETFRTIFVQITTYLRYEKYTLIPFIYEILSTKYTVPPRNPLQM
jgi:hypothetical protein